MIRALLEYFRELVRRWIRNARNRRLSRDLPSGRSGGVTATVSEPSGLILPPPSVHLRPWQTRDGRPIPAVLR